MISGKYIVVSGLGASTIKLLTLKLIQYRNKLECLSLSALSNICRLG